MRQTRSSYGLFPKNDDDRNRHNPGWGNPSYQSKSNATSLLLNPSSADGEEVVIDAADVRYVVASSWDPRRVPLSIFPGHVHHRIPRVNHHLMDMTDYSAVPAPFGINGYAVWLT
jgi:hypothetical protein